MRILVWGLGHIGTVSAACLAQLGHEVIGVEPDAQRRAILAAGRAPVQEPGLADLLHEVRHAGRFHVVEDGTPYVAGAQVSLICVGTPSADAPLEATGIRGGDRLDNPDMLSLDALKKVSAQIGQGLRGAAYHVVALRSTVPPGTTCDVSLPLLERHSRRRVGQDFGVGVVPEFLREGSALQDFREPPYTIIGATDARCAALLTELFGGVAAPPILTRLEEAELLKLVCNAFHGLKAAFANEVGRLCAHLGVDGDRVMELVRTDHKLNSSHAYLRPGFAFGGPCLLKDVGALAGLAQHHGLSLPVLEGILPSNDFHLESAHRAVRESAARYHLTTLGLLGLSFKSGTGDLRGSPTLKLLRLLREDGFTLRVYDPELPRAPEASTSNELSFGPSLPPDIAPLLCGSAVEVLQHCSLIVVTQQRPEFEATLRSAHPSKICLDLTRCPPWNVALRAE